MKAKTVQLLKDCGFDGITNDPHEISAMTEKIKRMFGIEDFRTDISDFLQTYNGLSVDASVAVRKSMKVYDFHGGFRVSLKSVINDFEYLSSYDFDELLKLTGRKLFPVGDAFAEILCISEDLGVYVGEYFAAESWEKFLDELADDKYWYSFT